jgi:hypothetical protein
MNRLSSAISRTAHVRRAVEPCICSHHDEVDLTECTCDAHGHMYINRHFASDAESSCRTRT